MNDAQRDLLLSARDSLEAARVLLDSGYPDYAASRAYYAMFYAAEAFLEGKGLSFSKHSAVVSAFGKEFAATGLVPTDYHKSPKRAEELRHVADYRPRRFVEPDKAKEQIERAERFLELARQMIGPILEE